MHFSRVYEPGFDITDEIELSSKTDLLSIYVETLPVLDDFGILCKRVTCLSHTADRINFAFTAFEHCLRRHCHLIEQRLNDETKSSVDWLRAMHLFQFMKLLHTFTKGWESIEFCGIFEQLEKSFRLSNDILEVIKKEFHLVFVFYSSFAGCQFHGFAQRSLGYGNQAAVHFEDFDLGCHR